MRNCFVAYLKREELQLRGKLLLRDLKVTGKKQLIIELSKAFGDIDFNVPQYELRKSVAMDSTRKSMIGLGVRNAHDRRSAQNFANDNKELDDLNLSSCINGKSQPYQN